METGLEVEVKIEINGENITCKKEEVILTVCKRKNIDIPAFCYHKALGADQRCGLCLVEVEEEDKKRVINFACAQKAFEGLKIYTSTLKVKELRKKAALLLLKKYDFSATTQTKELLEEIAGTKERKIQGKDSCFLCGLCIRACQKIGSKSLSFLYRSQKLMVRSTPLKEEYVSCLGCSACYHLCPTKHIQKVEEEYKITFEPTATYAFKFKCHNCKKPFKSKTAVDYLKQIFGPKKWLELCPECRRQNLARKKINKDGTGD